jgi:sensor c-di-GMP phosphodiesterase-like protein
VDRLLGAIANSSIRIEYQPIYNVESNAVSGFEALARWSDQYYGNVSAARFTQLAHDVGVSSSLTRRIVGRSIEECANVLASSAGRYLSLNFWANDLVDEGMLGYLINVCSVNRVRKSQIAIEILETSTVDVGRLQQAVEKFSREGFKIFLDDFGVGYSTLSYLARLKIDAIKIDKSFTRFADTQGTGRFILEKISSIAEYVGAAVIFEGVETDAQRLAVLNVQQHALAQGWLYSKALPIAHLEALLDVNQQQVLVPATVR